MNPGQWKGSAEATEGDEGFVQELRSAFRAAGIPVGPLDGEKMREVASALKASANEKEKGTVQELAERLARLARP